MQVQTPASISNQDEYNKSVNRAMSGNVSPGNGLTFDPNNQPLTYTIDNMVGIIVRIGSSSNLYGLPAAWAAADTALTIAHNLNKIPYGFIVIAKDGGATDVYWENSTTPATDTTITLYTTNPDVDTTIWILC